MIGNDAGELLPVIQADRDAGADAYFNWVAYSTEAARDEILAGIRDGGVTVQAFARHRLITTQASAGVLVKAAKALMARWPTDQHEGSPLYDEACALRQALSTTPTPASDGVPNERTDTASRLKEAAWQWRTGEALTLRGINLEPVDLEVAAMALTTLATTTPTPDRFGEGYRAGVEASAKVAEDHPDRLTETMSMPASQHDIATAIRALQPATGGE